MAGLEKDPHLARFIYVKILPDQAHLGLGTRVPCAGSRREEESAEHRCR
jgi:hypothetical protein